MSHKTPSNGSRHHFHQFEVAFCGPSGSGKTTLLELLARRWVSQGRTFGYVKHDAHRFDMDREGKDTSRLTASGARQVYISSPECQATILHEGSCPNSYHGMTVALCDNDFVVVEGFKTLPLPKFVFITAHGDPTAGCPAIPQAMDRSHVLGWIGPWPDRPDCLGPEDTTPYFWRDDIDGIWAACDTFLRSRLDARPLRGLVLAGGRSRRMGQDKALLTYAADLPQIERTARLLSEYCGDVCVSARMDQQSDYVAVTGRTVIPDRFVDFGPLGGILSAMVLEPSSPWLVCAVDMPLLTRKTLHTLITHRNPWGFATCYASAREGHLEPLCAIYEPKILPRLLLSLADNRLCPATILQLLGATVVPADAAGMSLANANTPEDFSQFSMELSL